MRRESANEAPHLPACDEAAPRYTLAGGLIGLPTRAHWARTALGGAALFGVPPYLMRALGLTGRRKALAALQRLWAAAVIRALDIRLDIAGLDLIDPHESYIVTPLHEGFADALALWQLPLRLRFVARDELFDWPRLGPTLRDTGQIMIWPEDGRRSYRELLRRAPAVLAAGESVVLFPQGTILGIETDFLAGPFGLARALGRPILPIVLTGAHRIWEHPYSARLRYGARLSLRVLPPLSGATCRASTTEALRREVQARIKGVARHGDLAAPRRFSPARDGYWDNYAYRVDPHFHALAVEVARHRAQLARSGPESSADHAENAAKEGCQKVLYPL